MSEIHLQRRHTLGLKKAKAAAQKVADDLAESFDIESRWDGNALHFSRSGVSGCLTVTRDQVALDAQLGFLLAAFKPRIEERIQKDFDRYFS
ncbi:MAG: polyhydroxyalkanoic acid system family protein [Burkholderiaceae bacterium]|nr:polyhydroxyalkanoic acid system family protein [Burkholderiaceae bacterium]